MKPAIYYYIVAGLALALIPLAPKLLSFRIAVLNGLHLKRLANWHDRNRRVLVPAVRLILLAIAVILIIVGASA